MTKSTKNKKTIYNYLDKDRYNIELSCKNNIIYLIDYKNRLLMNLTQQNAKDLIPILNEFAETGELK
jgi:c-di-AMP phosphodiesterase-like protein